MRIENGNAIVVVMQNPREKVFGILEELSPAGVFIRGIDLGYFDEWIKAINSGEPILPMQDTFYPMWRVERLSLDVGSESFPSMSELFEQKTGRTLGDF
ncbi:MAG: hypothetical protein OEM82_15575 [Acidobacteriota bacterium]|nr:hypothetical protein [Acidobacteriota bacterium]MDH3529531.1 hypothetical protein [Acidobacteriota bacterium]